MQIDREGIFLATFGERSVAPKGKNGLVAFQAIMKIETEETPDGPADISPSGYTIQMDAYLEKADGGVNEHAAKSLKESCGWDGLDPFWLEDTMPADTVVKLDIQWDEPSDPKYKPKLVVKWLNHKDSTGSGGITRVDKSEREKIKSRLNPKLRALNGGAAVKTPAPTGKPTMPAAAASAPRGRGRPPGPVKKATATMEEAWAAFVAPIPDGAATGEHMTNEWGRVLEEMFPGKEDAQITPEEWAKALAEAPAKYKPAA